MQLKSRTASEVSKRQTLQKPKHRAAAENPEAFKAVCKWLDARKISEDAAASSKAAQSKQAAM
jgi:hypothetical protein